MTRVRISALLLFAVTLAAGSLSSFCRAQDTMEINGEKVVTLKRAATSATKPEFTSVTVAPGRGFEVLQITSNFPGQGEVDVLASPDLPAIKQALDEKDDANGDGGYRFGAAILVPW